MQDQTDPPITVHNHSSTSSLDISSLAIALRAKSDYEMAHMCQEATLGNASMAPRLMKASQVQATFLDKLRDLQKEEMRHLLGEDPIQAAPLRVDDILDIAALIAQRVGPDPYPPSSNPDTYDPIKPDTWCTETWPDNKVWKKPFVATHLLASILDTCNRRQPRGRIPYISGPIV